MHATFQRGWVGSIEPTISIGHWIGDTQRDLAVYVKFPILPSLDITQVKKALKLPSHRYLPTPTKFYFLPPPYSVPPPSTKRPEAKIILISCFGKCQSYWLLVPLFVWRRPLEFCLPSIKKVKADLRLCRSWKRCWSSLHIQGKAPSELYQFLLFSNFRSIMSRPTSLLRCSC